MTGRTSRCNHELFEANVDVTRLTKTDGGPVTGYAAEVKVKCASCLTPFGFLGLAAGVHCTGPTVSADGLELRVPIEAQGKFNTPLDGYAQTQRRV